MKVFAGLLAGLAILGAGVALWFFEPWADEEASVNPADRSVKGQSVEELSAEFSGSACRRMAGLAATLAEREETAAEFLRAFGRAAAGIRPPPRAYGDLARGGRNLISGKGFLARFDDGTLGQARHFAGIAVASTFGGAEATRFLSIFVRDDPLGSADGQLTEEGILFSTEVLDGDLTPDETPGWLLEHLCRRS